jgi:phage/plasmid-like protein (TIGR03299 family)
MSHDIGKMFYCGERPWHKLGRKLDQPATLDEALSAGCLDWTVKTVPIVPAGEPDSTIAHRVAVVRNDRLPGQAGRVVGVVHPGFRPLQNREGAELFDSLLGQGNPIYHTGGYLRHGEVVWLLARVPHEICLGGNDVLEPYLLFTNSHDGSVAIDIRLSTIRVVCQNTLSMALTSGKVGKVFRRSHNGSAAQLQTEAKGFFEFAVKQCVEAEALFKRLANATCSPADFQAFLGKLIPDPRIPITAASNISVRRAHETRLNTLRVTRNEITAVHLEGIPTHSIAPAEDTWWGALNTLTGWVDHVQAIESDRYSHSLLGSGDRFKSLALARVQAEVS